MSSEGKIAIVAASGRFPGSETAEALWQESLAGRCHIGRFSAEEAIADGVDPRAASEPNYVFAKGVLDDPEHFDPAAFGFTPHEAALIDPQQRIFLEQSAFALDRAAIDPKRYAGRIGVFAGQFLSTLPGARRIEAGHQDDPVETLQLFQGNTVDQLAVRVAYRLGLTGPAMTVQTACSTALSAVHMGTISLLAGDCDAALCGAVCVSFPRRAGYRHFDGGIFSKSGSCRPFDANADGTVFGDGVGVFLLKRLEDALDDGDPIKAIILGSAANNDGSRKVGHSAPSVIGQREVIADALAIADITADSVGYVETHGAGTPLGDAIEIEALRQGYDMDQRRQPLYLGAAKAVVGHSEVAAGAAGLLRAIGAVSQGRIPPLVSFANLNPELPVGGAPFTFPDAAIDWPAQNHPRRAGVSAFGVGGTNVHVLLEEPPNPTAPAPTAGNQTFLVSAHSRFSAEATACDIAPQLTPSNLTSAAVSLAIGRSIKPYRIAVTAKDAKDAAEKLRNATAVDASETPQIVFLFPGQGSLKMAPLREALASDPLFRSGFYESAAPFQSAGVDIQSRLSGTTEGDLSTLETHAFVWASSMALVQRFEAYGLRPDVVIGHSLGELIAATVAGVFTEAAAAGLVLARGRLMESLPPGAMCVTGADLATIDALRDQLPSDVEIAAMNAPQNVVLSGPVDAIHAARPVLDAAGITHKSLPVLRAFHSAAVEPILHDWEASVRRAQPVATQLPLVSTLSGDAPAQPGTVEHWVAHMRNPVDFCAAASTVLKRSECPILGIELGTGTTLSGFVAQAAARLGKNAACVQGMPDSGGPLAGLATIWAHGGQVDPLKLTQGDGPRIDLPPRVLDRKPCVIPNRARAALAARTPDALTKEVAFETIPSGVGADQVARNRWLIVSNDDAQAQELRQRLEATGNLVSVAVPGEALDRVAAGSYRVDADTCDGWVALMRDLRSLVRTPTHILDMRHLDHPKPLTAQLRDVARLAQGAAQEATGSTEIKLAVLKRAALSVATQLLQSPDAAGMVAACGCISLETDGVDAGVIDVDGPIHEVDTRALTDAVRAASGGTPLAVRFNSVLRRTFRPVAMPDTSPLRAGGIYLIIGGTGGLGRVLAEHMVRNADATVILSGRSDAPSDLPNVHVRSCDATDAAATARLIDDLDEEFDGIDGLIFAAGHAEPTFTSDMDDATFARTWDSKVTAFNVLHQICIDKGVYDQLDFAIALSSTSTFVPGPGQVAYSAANAALSAAARGASVDDTHWTVVHLDTVNGVGMAVTPDDQTGALAALRQRWALAPEQVCQTLFGGLTSTTEIVVSRIDAQLLSDTQTAIAEAAGIASTAGVQHTRPDLATEYVAPVGAMEERIAGLLGDLLAIDKVGRFDRLSDLGADSLAAARLRARLQKVLGVELSIASLFRNDTVEGIAQLVAQAQDEP